MGFVEISVAFLCGYYELPASPDRQAGCSHRERSQRGRFGSRHDDRCVRLFDAGVIRPFRPASDDLLAGDGLVGVARYRSRDARFYPINVDIQARPAVMGLPFDSELQPKIAFLNV